MLFNSYTFVAFFLVVYPLYLVVSRHPRAQNVLLLIASAVFYGSWDWRFLGLLATSTVIDFVVVQKIDTADDPRRRRLIMTALVTFNLTVLGFFKYFGFFAGSFSQLVQAFGIRVEPFTLNIVLPVGISFYTFHELSYAIDVYRGELKASRSLVNYGVFVACFPLLVAGPIARARHLLPQVASPRTITSDRVNAALFLILWGYFKKVVVADNVAVIANQVFNRYQQYQGLDLLIGVLAFTVQIYGDFSGYSDIARGLAGLMGFEIGLNFRLPYTARSPGDFWTRWHISLSSWLRDYLYIPLGGNREGRLKTNRNLAVTMLLGGLWHGAAWNFVLWGGFHGAILIVYRTVEEWLGGRYFSWAPVNRVLNAGRILLMFTLTMIGWVLFRSHSAGQIAYILSHVGLRSSPNSGALAYDLVFYASPLLIVQWAQHRSGDLLVLCRMNQGWRVLAYSFFLVWIFVFGARETTEFIYFQF
jgi:alginate O-acetyltransferase complex protein AlgI